MEVSSTIISCAPKMSASTTVRRQAGAGMEEDMEDPCER